eukprot:CAMPEP_0170434200 /NCGR_PEP_ID=MMETSP0117_2-20130122/42915_1 /TAXON_ID=400756 /ORGANISM="Durinskia baltica, Strain CSIRO CS-38" /LENGTH=100 /DNA_ID=CAMNT_0010694021 /DNA_START=14 /DNA_END=313 /DNA_ORIENTATION=+
MSLRGVDPDPVMRDVAPQRLTLYDRQLACTLHLAAHIYFPRLDGDEALRSTFTCREPQYSGAGVARDGSRDASNMTSGAFAVSRWELAVLTVGAYRTRKK